MDLIDEQHVVLAQIRERAHQVTRLLQRRPGRGTEVHPQLTRDQLGERGLAQSGRTMKKRMIQRLLPRDGRIDVDAKALLHLPLPDELLEPPGAERELDGRVLGDCFGSGDLGAGHGNELRVAKHTPGGSGSQGNRRRGSEAGL